MIRRCAFIHAESCGSSSPVMPSTGRKIAARVRRKVENSAAPPRCMPVIRVHSVLADCLPLGHRVAPACPA